MPVIAFCMSSFAIQRSARPGAAGIKGWLLLVGYLVLYAAALFGMTRFGQFDAGDAIGVFLVLGVGFSLLAWLLTLGVQPLPFFVRRPALELLTLLLYLLPLAAFIAYGFAAIHRWVTTEPADSLAILAAKLLVFVAIPAWFIVKRSRYTFQQIAPMSFKTSHMLAMLGMSVAVIAFQVVAGRGWRDIVAANADDEKLLFRFPLVFLWLVMEVGVVEEFFFRVLLQSRLAATLRSELGGIVLASLLFGLVHAPGLYLRTGITQEGLGAHPSLFMAIGYSIVITSVAGFFFGVLWSRTRNFLLLVVVHAAADLLPNAIPTMRAFHLLK